MEGLRTVLRLTLRVRVARHVPRFLSVLELCTCANSSVKLNMPQPASRVTNGSSSIESMWRRSSISQVGAMDQFDRFEDFTVGFITSSLASLFWKVT